MQRDGSSADLNPPRVEPDPDAEPPGNEPSGAAPSTAALVFDADGRLIHVGEAFAKLVGVDTGSLVGTTHPFPWCKADAAHVCRDRIELLAGTEARKLGIESLSWRLSRHCGECLRDRYGAESVERAFENELRDAMCFAVCDEATMQKIREGFSSDAATPRRDLEAALRRIALEVERLGISVVLPVRPQAADAAALRLLSPRELEVLRPLMEGRRVASIARMLSISPHTVRGHLQSIYGKLGVRSQEELIQKLRRELSAPHLPEMPQAGELEG